MNRSKARDFFSDYYEDSLSPGLRQTMENAFASDPELRRDYEAFVALIGGLDSLRSEEIEPVGFLSERIEARLNQIDQERRVTQRPFFLRHWMPVMGTAVAGAALLGFLLAIQPTAPVDGDGAGVVGIGAPSITPHFNVEDGDTFLSYKASGDVRVTVRLGLGGEIIDSFSLNNETMRSPLHNETANPQLLEIEFSNSTTKLWVALPGQKQIPAGKGSGTVMDFAKALAGTYQIPVEVSTKYKDAPIDWNLNNIKPIHEVDDSMKDLGITIVVRESKVLLLAD